MAQVNVNSEDVIADLRLTVQFRDDGSEAFNLSLDAGAIHFDFKLNPVDLLHLMQFKGTPLRGSFKPIIGDIRSFVQQGYVVLDVDTLVMPTIGPDGCRVEAMDRKNLTRIEKKL